MLVKALLSLCSMSLEFVLNIFDLLPDFPQAAVDAIDSYLNLIFSNCSLISFFIPVDYCVALLAIAVAIANFDFFYKIVMWILKKIPILDIK